MLDKRFNSIHDSSEFSTSQFYLEPLIHPYENEKELAKEVKADPFGFEPRYNANFMYTRMLQAEYERTRSPSLVRTMSSLFGEGKRLTRNVEMSLPEEEGGQSISLNYDVQFVRGLVSLEAESETISNIQCIGNNVESETIAKHQKMRVQVHDGKMDIASRWIPGSRFILTPELNCFGNFEKPAYFMMVRRRLISENTLEYDLTPIMEQDCYVTSKIDFRMKSNDDVVQRHIEASSNFKDSTELSHMSAVPPYQSMWREAEKQSKARYSIDTVKTLDLLNFNYNRNTGRASSVIDFYKTSTLTVQCTNCYAFIGFDFHFKMDTTFVWIDILEATVEGNAKFAFETLVNFGYSYTNTWERTIFTSKLPSIRFSVGPIPVVIDPSVSMNAKLEVSARAVLRITHVASFSDRIKFGIKYANKQLTRVNERKGPTFTISAPKISDDSEAELNAKLTLIPKITLRFYSITPLDLSLLPYVRLNGKIGNASCGRAGASYNTYWGLNMMIQLQKLSIPKDIYGIGGKEFDLGGLLPFPKSSKDATFTVVSDRAINCQYCSGCVNLAKLWNSRNTVQSVSSFLEATAIKVDVNVGDDEPTLVPLGKSVYSNTAPESGKCHIYQTSKLDDALPAHDIFNSESDTRKSLISLEIYSVTGAILPSLKIYYADNLEAVRTKTAPSADVTSTKLIHEPWQNIYLAICNDNQDVPSSLRYSFQSKPTAEVSTFNVATPSLTIKKDHLVQIRFIDPRSTHQAVDSVVLVKNTLAGMTDATVHFYAATTESLIRMDSRYLISEQNSFSESNLHSDSHYPHTSHDYMVTVDVLGNSDEDAVVTLDASRFSRAVLRSPLTVPSNVNLVEVKRGDSPADEVWRYVVNIKGSEQMPSQLCFFTQQRSGVSAEKTCHDLTTSDATFNYVIPSEVVSLGYEYFMVELVGSHGEVVVTADEHVYIKSGRKSFFQLRSPSMNGDRFVLYRPDDVEEIVADKVVISGKTYSKFDRLCGENCELTIKVQLADILPHGEIVPHWVSETYESDIDGNVHVAIDFDAIASTLSPEKAQQVKKYRIIIDVASRYENVEKWFEMWADEVAHASADRRLFIDRVSMTNSGDIMYFQVPASLVHQLGGAAVARVKSFNPENPEESSVETGIPHLYVQKGALPRLSSYWRSTFDEAPQASMPMVLEEQDTNYYLGVATQSPAMNFKLEIQSLPATTVDITYYINGESVTSLTTEMLENYGLNITLTINSDDQEWSTTLTDPASNSLRKLIAHFSSNAYKNQFDVIQEQMLNAASRAFDPSTDVNPLDFIRYSKKVLSLKFPPFVLDGVVLRSDMTVNVDKNMDKSLFNSEDFRITIGKGGQFVVQRNSSNIVYYIVGIVCLLIFATILMCALSLVAFLIYKLVIQSKGKKMSMRSADDAQHVLLDEVDNFIVDTA